MPRLSTILGIAAVSIASILPFTHAEGYRGFELEAALAGTVAPSASVETVPEYIRDVPAHRNDSWAEENAAPIKDGSLVTPPIHVLGKAKYEIGTRHRNLDLSMGPTFGLKIPVFGYKRVTERNYMGAVGTDNRGVGTALTFYGLTVNGVGFWKLHCFVPGFFARASLVGKNNSNQFFLEYSTELNELNLINGWDRYNRLQKKDFYKVAGLLNHTIKMGYGKGSFGTLNSDFSFDLFMGVTLPQVIYKTSLYDETGASLSPSVILGASARQNFIHKKKKR